MSARLHEQVVRSFLEALISADEESLGRLVGPMYLEHCSWGAMDEARHIWTGMHCAYQHVSLDIHDVIVEGDRVAARYEVVCSGGQEEKRISAISIARICEGKVVEHWAHSDSFF